MISAEAIFFLPTQRATSRLSSLCVDWPVWHMHSCWRPEINPTGNHGHIRTASKHKRAQIWMASLNVPRFWLPISMHKRDQMILMIDTNDGSYYVVPRCRWHLPDNCSCPWMSCLGAQVGVGVYSLWKYTFCRRHLSLCFNILLLCTMLSSGLTWMQFDVHRVLVGYGMIKKVTDQETSWCVYTQSVRPRLDIRNETF